MLWIRKKIVFLKCGARLEEMTKVIRVLRQNVFLRSSCSAAFLNAREGKQHSRAAASKTRFFQCHGREEGGTLQEGGGVADEGAFQERGRGGGADEGAFGKGSCAEGVGVRSHMGAVWAEAQERCKACWVHSEQNLRSWSEI